MRRLWRWATAVWEAKRAWFSGVACALEEQLDGERGRWFYWLPVFFGVGVAIYFNFYSEPSLGVAVAVAILAIIIRVYFRKTSFQLLISSMILACALGFVTAKLRTWRVAAPILQKELRGAVVTGWGERWEQGVGKRGRLTIRVISISGLSPLAVPYRVRISMPVGKVPPAGAAVTIKTRLSPPPEPVEPGAFDFARQLYYMRIGAVGYGFTKPETPKMALPDPPWDLRFNAEVDRVRHVIADRVGAVISGAEGAVAKALIMGDQREVPQDVNDAMRNAGLFHVLSISGLHMSLVAGSFYWLMRGALALWPWAALHWPIKKWAAVLAAAGAFGYLLISGSSAAAERSFIMIAVLFLAIFLGRPAITLRNVAFSAGAILIPYPESLLDAGFQMSFAAVTALVALYEGRRFFVPPKDGPLWRRLALGGLSNVAAVSLTTIIAGASVSPLSAYHFHNIQYYAILGNLLGLPVVSYVVMPMSLAAFFAMPLGLERAPLAIMEQGLTLFIAIARWVASLPGAVGVARAFPASALMLMLFGGLWLCLWGRPWRYWGAAVFASGLAMTWAAPRPDVMTGREGDMVAVRGDRGLLNAPAGRKGGYSLDRWLEADGDVRKAKDAAKGAGWRCDLGGCVTTTKGRTISFALHPSALADDCERADILIAPFWLDQLRREQCPKPAIIIDKRDLWENGAHAIYVGRRLWGDRGGRLTLATVADLRGERPWVVGRRRKRLLSAVPPEDAPVDDAAAPKSAADEQTFNSVSEDR
jgi:competence protein ComEC